MPEITFGNAALAGLLSFLSPCVLPMLPFYLCYMAGLSAVEARAGAATQRPLIPRALAFAMGLVTVFVLSGLGRTAIGRAFADGWVPLSYLAAATLVLLGLRFLGVIRARHMWQSATGAFAIGLAFGFGWIPCIGPTLAGILVMTSGAEGVLRGAVLLLVYGMGMALPFVLIAMAGGPVTAWLSRRHDIAGHVQKAAGLVLILFGLLVATRSVNLIADWMIRSFDWSATLI